MTFLAMWLREALIAFLVGTTWLAIHQWQTAHDELVSYKATVEQERYQAGVLTTVATLKSNATLEKLNEQHKADLLTRDATTIANYKARFPDRRNAACGVRLPSRVFNLPTDTTTVDSQGASAELSDEDAGQRMAFVKACGADAQQVMDFQKLVRGNPNLMIVEGE